MIYSKEVVLQNCDVQPLCYVMGKSPLMRTKLEEIAKWVYGRMKVCVIVKSYGKVPI